MPKCMIYEWFTAVPGTIHYSRGSSFRLKAGVTRHTGFLPPEGGSHGTRELPEFFDVRRQQLPKPAELGQRLERVADVAERPRDVLDVDGVAPGRGLKAERAERLQISLQRHQAEAAAELVGPGGLSLERQEIGDQFVNGGIRK